MGADPLTIYAGLFVLFDLVVLVLVLPYIRREAYTPEDQSSVLASQRRRPWADGLAGDRLTLVKLEEKRSRVTCQL